MPAKRHPYGPYLGYRPVRLFVFSEGLKRWEYVATTTWARTCREACDELAKLHSNLARSNIKGRFA